MPQRNFSANCTFQGTLVLIAPSELQVQGEVPSLPWFQVGCSSWRSDTPGTALPWLLGAWWLSKLWHFTPVNNSRVLNFPGSSPECPHWFIYSVPTSPGVLAGSRAGCEQDPCPDPWGALTKAAWEALSLQKMKQQRIEHIFKHLDNMELTWEPTLPVPCACEFEFIFSSWTSFDSIMCPSRCTHTYLMTFNCCKLKISWLTFEQFI